MVQHEALLTELSTQPIELRLYKLECTEIVFYVKQHRKHSEKKQKKKVPVRGLHRIFSYPRGEEGEKEY